MPSTHPRPPRHQGTVASYDSAQRSGTVVCDNGQSRTFTADTLGAQLRLLRPGQRVHWLTDYRGDISYLTLITLPISAER